MGRHATTRLPVTGVEVLQLALLVIALFLVGARLRVRALRRKRGPAEPSRRGPAEPSRRGADLAYEEDFAAPISAHRGDIRPARRTSRRDEWPFPDPAEPPHTALLPSTATARRRAREFAMSDDRR